MGGTKIAAALVRVATGEVVEEALLQTRAAEGGDAVLRQVLQVAKDLQIKAVSRGLAVQSLGVGVPELVTLQGKVASAWNFDWHEIDLAGVLDIGLPLHVESDVRCAAWAEKCLGIGRKMRNFSYVSIGTGASAVHCIDGKLLRGANGFAIHFATSDLVMLEAIGGRRRFNLSAVPVGGCRRDLLNVGGKGLTTADLLAGKGGGVGLELLDQSIEAIASYLGQMVNMLDPQALIIGGGLGLAADYFGRLQQRVPEFIWADAARGLPILPSPLGNRSGVIGAACLGMGFQAG